MLVELSSSSTSTTNVQTMTLSKKLYEQEFERPFIAET
jgi:hypothetical protein